MKNYYQILGIEPNATNEEIKTAYKYLAKKFHPDMNPNDSKAKKYFQDIQEAYACLVDITKRNAYDKDFKQWDKSNANNANPIDSSADLKNSRDYINHIQKKYLNISLILIAVSNAIIISTVHDAISDGVVFIIPAILLTIYLYFLPTVFAYRSAHPNKNEIFVMNIFCFIPAIFPFGWIFLLLFSFNRIKGVNAIFLLILGMFMQNTNNKNNRS